MKKLFLLLPVIFIFFSGCSKNSEANSEIDKKWESVLLKCNGMTYLYSTSSFSSEFMEIKEYEIENIPDKISDSDKMNGLIWSGNSILRPKIARTCRLTKGIVRDKWGKWDDFGRGVTYGYAVKNINNSWQFQSYFSAYQPITCEFVQNVINQNK